ncbi:hypothetical protein SAMN05444487_11358 [Marininema mesophilum]|uniref:Uncharacterized protein n=1 Tax=Marininema mesophilum TaxID=1048340 RepID=A0A1H3AFH3_9BACL|nr:hypothetical protein [Marininema mesophilum]SDX28068.1 hypothetical protein SAMN05444487_11358 [Marininema mesophilum]
MAHSGADYDMIVISTDPSGVKAAKEAARSGKTTLLLQLHPGAVASVMCSTPIPGPNVGQSPAHGVEAFIVQPDDIQVDCITSTPMSSAETSSHHSVYILQSSEDHPNTMDTLREGDIYYPNEESIEEDPSNEEDPSSDAYTDMEEINPSEILRERELRNRSRMIHRTPNIFSFQQNKPSIDKSSQSNSLDTKSESSSLFSQPVIKERELNLRRPGSYRQKESPPSWKQAEENIAPSPYRQEESDHIEAQPPSTWGLNSTSISSESSEELEPTNPSSPSKTPLETKFNQRESPQGPTKPKRSQESEESLLNRSTPLGNLRPFGLKPERPSPVPDEDHVEGAIVWKAPQSSRKIEAPTSSANTQEASSPDENHASSFRKITYEPFSRSKKSRESSNNQTTQAKRPLSSTQKQESNKHQSPSPFPKRTESQKEQLKPVSQTQAPPSIKGKEPSPFMGEAARNILQNSTGLKRDSIDIEDPFGQSYEDLQEPFAQNNPQSEQLEKRKLALRGLHNLINNLG